MKNDGNVIYVGKTENGKPTKLTKSNVSYGYSNKSKIHNVKYDELEIVQTLDNNENWFNVKLNYIQKFKDDNKLLNANYLINNKKVNEKIEGGWWRGKIKDKHTINRLSESKFKEIVSYNEKGENPIIYNSIKQAAIEVFGDYKVINGSACSKLYGLLRNSIKNRFSNNRYWYYKDEIIEKHGGIINKIIVPRKMVVYEYNSHKKLMNVYFDFSEVALKHNVSPTGIKLNCLKNVNNLNSKFKTNHFFSHNNYLINNDYPNYIINLTKNEVVNIKTNKSLVPEKYKNGISFKLSNNNKRKRFYIKTN